MESVQRIQSILPTTSVLTIPTVPPEPVLLARVSDTPLILEATVASIHQTVDQTCAMLQTPRAYSRAFRRVLVARVITTATARHNCAIFRLKSA